jgi:hypothetical protein
MTNTGGSFDNGYVVEPASSLRPHQVTTGLTDLTVAAASEVIPGPNDYPLLYDLTGLHVLAAVAKIDVTPLSLDGSAIRPPAGTRARVLYKGRTLTSTKTGPGAPDPKDPRGRPLPPKL